MLNALPEALQLKLLIPERSKPAAPAELNPPTVRPLAITLPPPVIVRKPDVAPGNDEYGNTSIP
jgi:hypothetical protein